MKKQSKTQRTLCVILFLLAGLFGNQQAAFGMKRKLPDLFREHEPESKRQKLSCKFCDKFSCYRKEDYEKHLSRMHYYESNEKTNSSDSDSSYEGSDSDFEKPQQGKYYDFWNERKKAYVCDLCGECYKKYNSFSSHMVNGNENCGFNKKKKKVGSASRSGKYDKYWDEDKQAYACDLCGECYEEYKSFSNHILKGNLNCRPTEK